MSTPIPSPAGNDQLPTSRSVLDTSVTAAFTALVAVGILAGAGLFIRSLTMLAASSDAVYLGAQALRPI
jgi:hypothetical protein